jgi:hypothetical protein
MPSIAAPPRPRQNLDSATPATFRMVLSVDPSVAPGQPVDAVLCVHAAGMKELWCVAASDPEASAAMPVNHCACRWTIGPPFRDTRDLRFGMGLAATRIGGPMRRDRLMLVSAFAMSLLILFGAVGESLGMDRQLRSNTGKTRSYSWFRQGCMLNELLPHMPEHRLAPLIAAFALAGGRCPSVARIWDRPCALRLSWR